jgi:DNA-binding transcriptional ArsR family regulator
MGLPALTQHLTVLSGGGLIESAKAGRVVTHRLRADGFDDLATWIETRRSFWTHQLDALDDYLDDA